MSRPLMGGSAVAVALLSASMLFFAKPLVAETLVIASQDSQTQQKSDSQGFKVPGADMSPTGTTAEPGVANDKEKPGADSPATAQPAAEPAPGGESEAAGPPQAFTATAYSLPGRTASGRYVRRGVIAADRRVLPIGTRVRLHAGSYSGEYLVADTGGAVRGRKIDIWVPSTREALRFGRRPVGLTVLKKIRPHTAGQKKGK